MKVTLRREAGAEKEIVIRFDAMDAEVRAVLELLSFRDRRLAVDDGGALRLLEPKEILYCESVDDHTYAYTASGVYGVGQTLSAVAEAFSALGFFRCSKSMAVNLRFIETLKSGASGRIIATLQNGERILVSRRYAGALREKLKGDERE
jgi:DNA-binding LytR/AlgR family response regulator